MDLGNSFYMLVGGIVLLGGIALVGNLQLASFFRHWLEQLKQYEHRAELLAQARPNHLLEEMIEEYSQYRKDGLEWINTQALIEQRVYKEQLNLFGLFRLPISVIERVILQIPSWVIILGLLGTFAGLTMALFAMQGALVQFGTDAGDEMLSVSSIVAAIAEPFQGMSFAFLTSIAGIGMSFILTFLQSGFLSKLGIGPNAAQLKQLFLTRCEGFLDHQVQKAVQQQKPTDSLERVLDRLVDKVKESFDQSVAAFGGEIIQMTKRMEGSIEGLSQVVTQSQEFTSRFYEGTSQLTDFGAILQATITQFQKHEDQVAGRLEQLNKQITLLQQELKQLTQRTIDSNQGLQKMMERSDQIVQQSVRRNEEMNQLYRQQGEENQRKFYEIWEEQKRNEQQRQDQWHYRYQEKNDQFSRAAESFGQAVQHLERQWEEGTERFKRDMLNQMGQIIEKTASRQQNSQTSERELRDMIRGLESIHHLLEREFQNIYRFSQDANQILYTIYEWGRSQMSQKRYENDESARPVVRERRY
ncbi:hypothetical protein [Bacillus horti]|uniref:Methyl-accepting chemotaxis protein n=1 Tax=Caldalkalibacillus horti TaxID=77523 RepID=A0ABT9W0R3_9BACI|nr:hypothetical protein [Bacillus horti]MDQ0166796.1 methyl-accepting chemotaxis protein [Bacillus horti]